MEQYTPKQIFKIRIRLFLALFVLLSLAAVIPSCEMPDERDVCCYNVRIDYRYYSGGEDVFKDHIHSVRHFLFDADSVLQEVTDVEGDEITYVERVLPAGKYTMLSFANIGTSSQLDSFRIGVTRREDLSLSMNNPDANGYQQNSERLFFALRDFEVKPSGIVHYLADFTHAHNILTVRVKMKNGSFGDSDLYYMELTNVPGSYRFFSDDKVVREVVTRAGEEVESSEDYVVYAIPELGNRRVAHRAKVYYKPGALEGSFITYRYRNNAVPLFCLYSDEGPMMKEIDLSKFFATMGWELTLNITQEFDITITIDGERVYVSPTMINDWEDGGVIGATTK
ncbi:MAG: FimB/Mfa2 family fimbrial subunit [Massilibacteroides sp.]|nr:FimB/Mfa2 family fimbrial subunit [Massilibacteroides sp.]MDD3062307.1 FimB/Mfa2 family fimbrial subunit [Massilibacteroides sp.]MDD4115660.1 FimB/Mfa2 family fimbrial subunit [Massilibacteroides sp.]MDD4661425.1 FimB/Mfa2 family fimbrial subunit [Massilibacteroides sp.]